jgi:arginine N-succinyltransferase
MIIRPVQARDLESLSDLANRTSHGLTTLPKDPPLLAKRIRQSERSFADLDDADPRGQLYLFVMEDPDSQRVIGTSGIVSKVGGFKPFYAFRVDEETQHSETLNCTRTHRVLYLIKEHDGPSEIGSLFLHPDYRGGGNGRLLSLSRFLFMAEFPNLFEKQVIAEMRGVIHDAGDSPFWDALGNHFFGMDYPNADMLSLINKDFIEELMPRHPIYLDLLPAEAQAAVGEVHRNTRPARKLLESEGFRFQQYVDIFEAGPTLHVARDEIRCVRESRVRQVKAVENDLGDDAVACLVCTTSDWFRATTAMVRESESGVRIDRDAAKCLFLDIGQAIRIVETRPNTERQTKLRSE